MKIRLIATALLTFALSGCGGAAFGPKVYSAVPNAALRTSRQTNVRFTLYYGIPKSGPNSKVKSFRIKQYGSHAPGHVWDIAKTSDCVSGSQCSTFVKGDPAAPFLVESYDGAGGTGRRLSTSIVYDLGYSSISGVQLSLNQGYGSIVTSLRVTFVPPNPRFGVASRMALAATAMSNRSFIVGPAPYRQPITLSVSGGMHLSTTKVLNPGQPVSLSYAGAFDFATVTASARSSTRPYGTFKSDPTTVRPMLLVTERDMHAYNGQLSVAGDGSIWLASVASCALVKVQPDLTTQKYRSVNEFGCPGPVTTGPDGRIWFSSEKKSDGNEFIGSITSDGTFAGYAAPSGTTSGLATGSDGRLWAVDGQFRRVYAITTAGVFTTAPFALPKPYNLSIFAGPDGNLWIPDNMSRKKGFFIVDTSGESVTFLKAVNLAEPILATNEYLYAVITKPLNKPTVIGKWNAKRELVATYQVGGIGDQLTVDDGGALWFNVADGVLGRVSSDGTYCELAIPPSKEGYVPHTGSLIAAPDGYLYYSRGESIGKIRIPD